MEILALDIDPNPVTAWVGLVVAVLTAGGLVIAAVKRINDNFERRVTALVKETTKPIQPNTNGGKSLSDLHAKVDRMDHRYLDMFEVVHQQRELWHERYIADQEKMRKEWTAVFMAIRKMIHLSPEEQSAMWDEITESYIDGSISEKYLREDGNDVY